MSRPAPSYEADLAGSLIAAVLRRRAAGRQGMFLRELIRHAVASLAVLEGDRAASEACYQVADAAAACGEPPSA